MNLEAVKELCLQQARLNLEGFTKDGFKCYLPPVIHEELSHLGSMIGIKIKNDQIIEEKF